MLKKVVFASIAVLLFCSVSQAMIILGQGYSIGAVNAGDVDGMGVATGGSVVEVDNKQSAMNLDGCLLELGTQQQAGILVQGGTAIGLTPGSSASYLQGAGASSGQGLFVANEPVDPIWAGQGTTLCLGQAVSADNGAAANAGQGAILANGQFAASNNGAVGNASIIGAVNTSSAIAGPCSEAMSGNIVNVNSYQSALVN